MFIHVPHDLGLFYREDFFDLFFSSSFPDYIWSHERKEMTRKESLFSIQRMDGLFHNKK